MIEKRDKLNPKKSQDSRVESFPHTAEQDGNLEGRWKSIVGRVEDDPSFSAVLVENVAFRDWAEASTHNMDSQKWFERVILCSQDGDEEWLNSLCQNINQKLLLLLLETWSERKDGRVGASFFSKSSRCCRHQPWMDSYQEPPDMGKSGSGGIDFGPE